MPHGWPATVKSNLNQRDGYPRHEFIARLGESIRGSGYPGDPLVPDRRMRRSRHRNHCVCARSSCGHPHQRRGFRRTFGIFQCLQAKHRSTSHGGIGPAYRRPRSDRHYDCFEGRITTRRVNHNQTKSDKIEASAIQSPITAGRTASPSSRVDRSNCSCPRLATLIWKSSRATPPSASS